MKKLLSLILALILLLSAVMLASCSKTEEPATGETGTKTAQSAEKPDDQTGEKPTEGQSGQPETEPVDQPTDKTPDNPVENIEKMTDAAKKSVSDIIDRAYGVKEIELPDFSAIKTGLDASVKVTVSETLSAMIGALISSSQSEDGEASGAPAIDLSFLKSFAVNFSGDLLAEKKSAAAAISLLLNEVNIVSGDLIVNAEEGTLLFKAPFLGPDYISIPLDTVAQLFGGLFGGMNRPGHGGFDPDYPGYDPDYPGYDPDYPGYDPDYPGYDPDYPGYDPEFPGDEDSDFNDDDPDGHGMHILPYPMPGEGDDDPYGEYEDRPIAGGIGIDPDQLMQYIALFGQISEVLPDAAKTKEIASRYIDLFFSKLADPAVEKKALTVVDLSAEYTATTYTVTPAIIVDTAKAVIAALKDDADVKKIIFDVAALILPMFQAETEISGDAPLDGETPAPGTLTPESTVDRFVEALTLVLDKIEKTTEEELTKIPTVYATVYTDADHDCKGAEITVLFGEKKAAVSILSAKKDNQTAASLTVDVNSGNEKPFNVTITYTDSKNGDLVTADLIASLGTEKLIDIYVKDLDTKALSEGRFVGRVAVGVGDILNIVSKFAPENEQISAAKAAVSMLGQLDLYVEGKDAENVRAFTFGLASAEADLFTVDFTCTMREAKEIPAVESIPFEQIADSISLVDTVFPSIMIKLREAGVPEEIIASIEMMITPAPVWEDEFPDDVE